MDEEKAQKVREKESFLLNFPFCLIFYNLNTSITALKFNVLHGCTTAGKRTGVNTINDLLSFDNP